MYRSDTAGSPLARSGEYDRLLVIIPDRLSDLARKGEIITRYYNPGNLFREVHILMTNDDRPHPAAIIPTVGNARLVLHNLPAGMELFVKSFGWRPSLLRAWTNRAVALAATIKPELIRCHGARLNAYAAQAIKSGLGIPYVVSLHTNPDVSVRGRKLRSAIMGCAAAAIERKGLLDADLILPVYQSIEPFLQRIGASPGAGYISRSPYHWKSANGISCRSSELARRRAHHRWRRPDCRRPAAARKKTRCGFAHILSACRSQ
jgi:hypothetical protein